MYNRLEVSRSRWPHAEQLLWEAVSVVHQHPYCLTFAKVRVVWRLAELKAFPSYPKGTRSRSVTNLVLTAGPSHSVEGWLGFCCARGIWGFNPFSPFLIALSAVFCFQGLLPVGSNRAKVLFHCFGAFHSLFL